MTDGVRIPAANHFYALNRAFEVDVLLLEREDCKVSLEEHKLLKAMAPRTSVVSVARSFWVEGLVGELFFRRPYFGAFKLINELPEWVAESTYDVVWCATAPAAGMFSAAEARSMIAGATYVAGLSDMHSLVLWRQGLEAGKSASKLQIVFSDCSITTSSYFTRSRS